MVMRVRFGGPVAEAKDAAGSHRPGRRSRPHASGGRHRKSRSRNRHAGQGRHQRAHGTIVIGADVRVSPVAVSYGTLTVQVTETPQPHPAEPFSRGVTAVQPQTDIIAQQTGGNVALLDGPDLKTLVAGLNNIGVKPDGIIAILQGIKSVGALVSGACPAMTAISLANMTVSELTRRLIRRRRPSSC